MPAQVSQTVLFRGVTLYLWTIMSPKQASSLWSHCGAPEPAKRAQQVPVTYEKQPSARDRTLLMHTPKSMEVLSVKLQPDPGGTHPPEKTDGAGSKLGE